MGEVMTQAIIGMPYDMAMSDELSRRQFHDRAQYLLGEHEKLQAENAKLRAGQESLLLNLAEQKRQAVEYREMWAKAAERANAQSSDLSFLSEYIVGREYGTELPNYEAIGRYPVDVAEAALSAPSAPKADPIKVQLLEALEYFVSRKAAILAKFDVHGPADIAAGMRIKLGQAESAIAAARQEGGKV